jgi:hypothetical protein
MLAGLTQLRLRWAERGRNRLIQLGRKRFLIFREPPDGRTCLGLNPIKSVQRSTDRYVIRLATPRKRHSLADGERLLVAIMFTVTVRYTALMQSNEAQPMAVLDRDNRLLEPSVF